MQKIPYKITTGRGK